MNDSSDTIKDLIRYLDDVNRGKQIERQEPDFFKLTKDLDNVFNKYYISFKTNKELKEQMAYNYNLIKDMSFPESKEVFFRVKDLSNHSKPNYSNEQYNSYARFVHSYLVRKFEDKLRLNKEINRKKITVKNKKIFKILERVNLEIEFLKEDVTATDFINVLIGASKKEIHLNISNRDFHYLITKLKGYFYNLTHSSAARTNKFHSKSGPLKIKNFLNSKSENPKKKNDIDRIFKKF